jgi:hypothetical protein
MRRDFACLLEQRITREIVIYVYVAPLQLSPMKRLLNHAIRLHSLKETSCDLFDRKVGDIKFCFRAQLIGILFQVSGDEESHIFDSECE